MNYLEHSFPVQQYEEYTDDKGNTRSRPVVDSAGNPVLNREAVAMRDALLRRLGMIRVPDGGLDMIIRHFGIEKVAEATGRSQRVVDKTGRTRQHPAGCRAVEQDKGPRGYCPLYGG